MNSVLFESAREKEKARADLREVREQMLEQAKKQAELRAERDAAKHLKGETNWMLPSVEKKLKRKDKEERKKKKKKDAKKVKKSKKKSNKKRMHCSSSDNESDDSIDTDSSSTTGQSSSASSDEVNKRKKRSKKSKNKRKLKKYSKNDSRSDNDSDEKAGEWVEAKTTVVPMQRDSWMTESLMLKTYSRERTSTQPKENQHIDTYDPSKSSRELNPYWKTTGTGLPAFQKPRDEDIGTYTLQNRSKNAHTASEKKGWRKHNSSNKTLKETTTQPIKREATPPRGRSPSSSESSIEGEKEENNAVSTSLFLTDQQMNELGAKIMKAEIMGNMSLADELRQKLDNARTQRSVFKERKQKEIIAKGGNKNIDKPKRQREEEHILLTHTDQSGQSRPVTSRTIDPRDMYGGKVKKKRAKTHDSDGQRVRYFADDDRYNLKEMFESEKMTSVSDANLQFADIASKNKNPNDDLEDIFADNICKDDSMRDDRKNRDRAIREQHRMESILDNCDKCFDSTKLRKELLVSVGEKVYLALPWYQGLQSGHCMIIPTQHSTCSTQLDEDTWSEISDYRKALARMFAAQRKDVIFFEIANRLHKRPHLVIHCIPIKETEGEMAPFYFKKAIEESEHEWSVNKQLVSLRKKSLRNCIPKGLPYFWVNFGMDTGFAHVIEDEDRFPPNFAQEIIGGMLHLDPNKWRRIQKETNIITKVKMFADWWKKYDCTN